MFRIGEASVPGPEVAPTWSIGICNPSGLQAKHHIVGDIKSTVLAVSETHLTKGSKRHLQSSLRSMRSDFKQVLTGAPMSPRTTSDAGGGRGLPTSLRCLAEPWPRHGHLTFTSPAVSSLPLFVRRRLGSLGRSSMDFLKARRTRVRLNRPNRCWILPLTICSRFLILGSCVVIGISLWILCRCHHAF